MPVTCKYIKMNSAVSREIPQTQWVQLSKASNWLTSLQSTVLLVLSLQGQVFKDTLSKKQAVSSMISVMIVNGTPSTIFIGQLLTVQGQNGTLLSRSFQASVAHTFQISDISFMFSKQAAVLHFPCVFPANPFSKLAIICSTLEKDFPCSWCVCLGLFRP